MRVPAERMNPAGWHSPQTPTNKFDCVGRVFMRGTSTSSLRVFHQMSGKTGGAWWCPLKVMAVFVIEKKGLAVSFLSFLKSAL